MNIKERLKSFFIGRYGYDDFNLFLLILYLILSVIHLITRNYWLSILEFAVLIFLIFRMLSKNLEKRRNENKKYLNITAPIRNGIKNIKSSYKSDYKFFSCPTCNQRVRVPKGKGKIEVKCPKCGKTFIKRS